MEDKNKKDYVLIRDYTAQYVVTTGKPNSPANIQNKLLAKGSIVKGILHKDKQGNPTFVMVGETMVVPVTVLKKVVTKGIESSSFEGDSENTSKPMLAIPKAKNNKEKYMDAVIIGAIAGFLLTIVAEKKGWLGGGEESENPYQFKAIGAGIGALAGAYFVYRFTKKKSEITVTTNKQ